MPLVIGQRVVRVLVPKARRHGLPLVRDLGTMVHWGGIEREPRAVGVDLLGARGGVAPEADLVGVRLVIEVVGKVERPRPCARGSSPCP